MLTAAAVTAVTSATAVTVLLLLLLLLLFLLPPLLHLLLRSYLLNQVPKLYFALVERTYSEGGQRLSQFVVRVRPQYLCDHSRSISVQMLLPQYFVTSAAAATCMLLSRTIYKTQYKDL